MLFDFRRDLDLEFSRSNTEFTISAKNDLIATKQKENLSIGLYKPQI